MKTRTPAELLTMIRIETDMMMKLPRGNYSEFKRSRDRVEKLIKRYQEAGGDMSQTMA